MSSAYVIDAKSDLSADRPFFALGLVKREVEESAHRPRQRRMFPADPTIIGAVLIGHLKLKPEPVPIERYRSV